MSQTWGKADTRKLGYAYRADGMFLCRATCADCGEGYDVIALAQATPVDRCPACQQVQDWVDEMNDPPPPLVRKDDEMSKFWCTVLWYTLGVVVSVTVYKFWVMFH